MSVSSQSTPIDTLGLRHLVTHIHDECQHVLVRGRRQSSADNVGYITGVPAMARNDA